MVLFIPQKRFGAELGQGAFAGVPKLQLEGDLVTLAIAIRAIPAGDGQRHALRRAAHARGQVIHDGIATQVPGVQVATRIRVLGADLIRRL